MFKIVGSDGSYGHLTPDDLSTPSDKAKKEFIEAIMKVRPKLLHGYKRVIRELGPQQTLRFGGSIPGSPTEVLQTRIFLTLKKNLTIKQEDGAQKRTYNNIEFYLEDALIHDALRAMEPQELQKVMVETISEGVRSLYTNVFNEKGWQEALPLVDTQCNALRDKLMDAINDPGEKRSRKKKT